MLNILQRNWFTMVRQDTNNGQLDARTVYLGTDGEMSALLKVTSSDFVINQANWETYSPSRTSINVHELIGVVAYLGSGAAIKKALKNLGPFPRSLFAETVRGIIQAETFIWAERGFNTAEAYSLFWEKMYANSCHYYSNLDKVEQTWSDYACAQRTSVLFNRFKSQFVYQCPGGMYRVHGQLSDSFHEVSVNLVFNRDLEIVEARGELLRAPDQVCRAATAFLAKMPGQRANQLSKKEIATLLGGGNGCVHIIDTVYDGIESMQLALNKGVKIHSCHD